MRPSIATSLARGLGIALIGVSMQCPAKEPLIAIDVGHSRSAPGAISAHGVPEFDFNLALAKELHAVLTAQGTPAILIGEAGDMTSLTQRTAIASEKAATFFISIHHDSAQPQYLQAWKWNGISRLHADRFSGFSLFVSHETAQPEASLRCAATIGTSLKEEGMRPSSHHAEAIAGESRQWADRNKGVYYYDRLAVLRTATMPAVLLEAGVIVNRDEERRLQRPEVRRMIAVAVARGLSRCGALGSDDKNGNAATP